MYTNIASNGVIGKGEMKEYDTFGRNVNVFYSKELEKAPLPTVLADTIMRIINQKNSKFNYLVGKGASIILILQRFAYNAFESSVLKRVNQTK